MSVTDSRTATPPIEFTVKGDGTASFYGSGNAPTCTDFDLSFDEGLSVSLKVCTSDTRCGLKPSTGLRDHLTVSPAASLSYALLGCFHLSAAWHLPDSPG